MHSGWTRLFIGTLLLAVAVYAVASINGGLGYRAHKALVPVAIAPVQPPSATGTPSPASAGVAEVTAATPEPAITIPPLPANAVSVPDEDLLRLSAMVDLANAADRPPDKAGWQQALLIADRLQQGPCDCEQRNWLHHFVETGNSALTASADYAENVQVMLTLARNDQQAMERSHQAN